MSTTTDNLRLALERLREEVAHNDPISLTDAELAELALLATTELRTRLPLSAVRQGDLDENCQDEAKARERDADHAREAFARIA